MSVGLGWWFPRHSFHHAPLRGELMGCKRKPDRLFQRLSLVLRTVKSSADFGQK